MNKKIRIFLVILSVILIILSIVLMLRVYDINKDAIIQNFDSYLIVSNEGGIGLVPGVVFFGKMRPGDSATATIYLNSTFKNPLIAQARAKGVIKKFFVNNDFILQPYENKSIYLTVIIPKNTSLGRYDGQIEITLRKALF